MRALVGRYCSRETVCVVAAGVAATSLLTAGLMFSTAGPRGTALGVHLGADYASFYSAGLLLNGYGEDRLYDLGLQDRILHHAVEGVPAADSLPFPYPPFVAQPFRFLAALPYAWSFAAWLAVSAVLYGTAVGLTLWACPEMPRADRLTVWLLAFSFGPFAIETWLGGQVSCVGAAAVAAAIACHRAGRPGWAGVALSALLYKPTLPALIVLMLVAGRRWRTLAGFGAGASALAAVTIGLVGIEGGVDYARFLAWFGRQREGLVGVFPEEKHLDLSTAFTLLGADRESARLLALAFGLPVATALALAWRRSWSKGESADLVWAATVCFLPLLSNYGPIYDAAIVVPGLILGADVVRRRHPAGWPAGFVGAVAVCYAAGLTSTFLAERVGVQALTPALAAIGLYLLRGAFVTEVAVERGIESAPDASSVGLRPSAASA